MNIESLFRQATAGLHRELLLAAGDITGRILTMLAWAMIARTMGSAGFGLVSWALAIVGYLSIVADGGLAALGVRELARNPSTHDVRAIFRLRLCLSIGVILAVTCMAYVALDEERWLVLSCAAAWLLPMGLNPEWLMQGQHRIVAIGVLRCCLGGALLAATVVWSHWPIGGVVMAAALRAVSDFIIVTAAVALSWNYLCEPKSRARSAPALLRNSFPLAAAALLTGLYAANFDVLALSYFRSNEEAGLYAAAFRIYLIMAVLPKLLLIRAYPRFAAAADDPRELQAELDFFLARTLQYSLPGVAMCGIIAPDLITMIYGNSYDAAAPVLKWLVVAAIPLLLNAPLPSALLAAGRANSAFKVVTAALVISILMNLVATPRWGMPAAAIAVILAEATVLAVGLYYCRRELDVSLDINTGLNGLRHTIAVAVVSFVTYEFCKEISAGNISTTIIVSSCALGAWIIVEGLGRRKRRPTDKGNYDTTN